MGRPACAGARGAPVPCWPWSPGCPCLLFRLGGHPIPSHVPSWHTVTSPCCTGTTEPCSSAPSAISLAGVGRVHRGGWLEVQASLRGRRPPRLRLGGLQSAAGWLVTLTALAFSSQPAVALASMPPAPVAAVSAVHPETGVRHPQVTSPPASQVMSMGFYQMVTVHRGDCLWTIAQRYLGDGDRSARSSSSTSGITWRRPGVHRSGRGLGGLGAAAASQQHHRAAVGRAIRPGCAQRPRLRRSAVQQPASGRLRRGCVRARPAVRARPGGHGAAIRPGPGRARPRGQRSGHGQPPGRGSRDPAGRRVRGRRAFGRGERGPGPDAPPPAAGAPVGRRIPVPASAPVITAERRLRAAEEFDPESAPRCSPMRSTGRSTRRTSRRVPTRTCRSTRRRQRSRPGTLRTTTPAAGGSCPAPGLSQRGTASDQARNGRGQVTALRAALSQLGSGLVTAGQPIPRSAGFACTGPAWSCCSTARPGASAAAVRGAGRPAGHGLAARSSRGRCRCELAETGDLLPGLLTAGVDADGGYLLIDLEQLRVTTVDGPPDLAERVLATAAMELTTSQLAGWYDLILAGFPELQAVDGRATSCDSLGEALDLLATKAVALRRRLGDTERADLRRRRLADPGDEDWALTLLVSRTAPSIGQMAMLLDLASEPGGLAALVAGGTAVPTATPRRRVSGWPTTRPGPARSWASLPAAPGRHAPAAHPCRLRSPGQPVRHRGGPAGRPGRRAALRPLVVAARARPGRPGGAAGRGGRARPGRPAGGGVARPRRPARGGPGRGRPAHPQDRGHGRVHDQRRPGRAAACAEPAGPGLGPERAGGTVQRPALLPARAGPRPPEAERLAAPADRAHPQAAGPGRGTAGSGSSTSARASTRCTRTRSSTGPSSRT